MTMHGHIGLVLLRSCWKVKISLEWIPENTQQLKQMLIEEWALLPQEMLHQLVLSMRRRCEATIAEPSERRKKCVRSREQRQGDKTSICVGDNFVEWSRVGHGKLYPVPNLACLLKVFIFMWCRCYESRVPASGVTDTPANPASLGAHNLTEV
ncbi:hypothetical protein TNCV_170971 [Trichonephila clavipes]|nr:hypothetical protein TNCV_170971 [Trichonephila clavipes]